MHSRRVPVLLLAWAAGLTLIALIVGACTSPTSVPPQAGSMLVWSHQPPAALDSLHLITANGDTLAAGTWTNAKEWRLTYAPPPVESGISLVAEAEFVPASQPFTGTPNVTGPIWSMGKGLAAPALTSGKQYHWQVRAREVGGVAGAWTEFSGQVGYQADPPPAPQVTALPNDGQANTRDLTLSWDATDNAAGLAGFAFALQQQNDGSDAPTPPADPVLKDHSTRVTVPGDGDWVFTVWAKDNAGNWSAPGSTTFHVDTTPPAVTDLTARQATLTPGYQTATIAFTLNEPADVTVTVLPSNAADNATPVRTLALGQQPAGPVSLEWDGNDEAGAAVASGAYPVRIHVADGAGNAAEQTAGPLLVSHKRIEISLSQQRLWAYDGDTLVLDSLVTSGGPDLPTPTGTFEVLARFSPFTFRSPWPKGSPYWYPDSPSSFALLYDDGGYFLHDAPWRGRFGPGSNTMRGTPGGNNTGTHGCINVPYNVQARLFPWAPVGTPVIIRW